VRGTRFASIPAVVLAVAIAAVLVAYSLPFIRDRSQGPVLLPAGTVLTLGSELPPMNVSFWVFLNGTRLAGRWASDGPGNLFVGEYGLSASLMIIPHGVLSRCGGSLDLPLTGGHYTMTFVLGSSNVTHFTVLEPFALGPATGAPPGASTVGCPNPAS
jgi:hypothetical protein